MKINSAKHELEGSDVDEPEDFEESGSDWEPHDEEDDDEQHGGKKKRGRPRPLIRNRAALKKRRVPVAGESEVAPGAGRGTAVRDSGSGGLRLKNKESPMSGPSVPEKAFTNGSFVVLKSDFRDKEKPPLWKIDGKALLQKYVPIESEGRALYKSTSTYSGWTQNNQHEYASAPVTYVQQGKKEIIIEFNKDQVNL